MTFVIVTVNACISNVKFPYTLKLNIAHLKSRYIHGVSVKVGKEWVGWFFHDDRLVL